MQNQPESGINAPAALNTVGVHLMEMRCPSCKATQYFKLRTGGDHLTGCTHCGERLVVSPVVQQKPNAVKVSLSIVIVPDAPKLRVVSGEGEA